MPPKTTLVDVLRYWANVQPNKVAFYYTDGETDDDSSMTFAELETTNASELRQLVQTTATTINVNEVSAIAARSTLFR